MRTLIRGRRSRLLGLIGLLALSLLLGTAPALAVEGRGGDQVIIGAEEVITDDLYLSGNTVTIDGTVNGDVFAIGSTVTINGVVKGDLMAAAQAVIINGVVDDDVRIGGYALQLGPNARVGSDAIVMGYSLEAQRGSAVGQDLFFGGRQAVLAGSVGRDLTGGMTALELRGAIERNVEVALGDAEAQAAPTIWVPESPVAVPPAQAGLRIADDARIGGTLAYTSSTAGQIDPAAQIGGAVTRTPAPVATVAPERDAPNLVLDLVRRYITLLLIGALLIFMLPAWTTRLAETVGARPLPSLGWGIVSYALFIALALGVPVVGILVIVLLSSLTLGGPAGLVALLTIVGEGALIGGFLVFVSYIVQVIVSFFVGRWLIARVQPEWNGSRFWPLALGLALYVVLRAIPVLGTLIALLVTLLGLGALWLSSGSRLARPTAGAARPAPLTASPAV